MHPSIWHPLKNYKQIIPPPKKSTTTHQPTNQPTFFVGRFGGARLSGVGERRLEGGLFVPSYQTWGTQLWKQRPLASGKFSPTRLGWRNERVSSAEAGWWKVSGWLVGEVNKAKPYVGIYVWYKKCWWKFWSGKTCWITFTFLLGVT